MKRVRFAPSPTGSLHVGNALSAVANRDLGDWMLLRIDDTDAARNVPGGEGEILSDLEWLGVAWDEGPVRQSERQDRYREAAEPLGGRFDGITLLRQTAARRTTSPASSTTSTTGSPTSSVATTIGRTRRSTVGCSRRSAPTPPEFVHHGLILGEDGKKLAKRAPGATVASLRDAGIPAEAVRTLPRGARGAEARRALRPPAHPPARRRGDRPMTTRSSPRRVGAPVEVVPALRGARDLNEAREYAAAILTPPAPAQSTPGETLARFRELLERTNGDGGCAGARARAQGGRRRPEARCVSR